VQTESPRVVQGPVGLMEPPQRLLLFVLAPASRGQPQVVGDGTSGCMPCWWFSVAVAQQVRAPGCGPGGRLGHPKNFSPNAALVTPPTREARTSAESTNVEVRPMTVP
jgi:hypothetical protein